jgi:hypothetical protein
MPMRASLKLSVLLALAIPLAGCRYKGWESFTSATNPNPPLGQPTNPGKVVSGDAYTFGGIDYASGGLKPQTNYGIGSDPNSTARVDNRFDQPEMGSGQASGDLPNEAVAGAAQENGPGLQPQPGDLASGPTVAHG